MTPLHLHKALRGLPIVAQRRESLVPPRGGRARIVPDEVMIAGLDRARDAIRALDAAGIGIRGVVAVCEDGSPIIHIDRPPIPLLFLLPIVKLYPVLRRELPTRIETTWLGCYGNTRLMWTAEDPKPRRMH
jgi:hypothetical protein